MLPGLVALKCEMFHHSSVTKLFVGSQTFKWYPFDSYPHLVHPLESWLLAQSSFLILSWTRCLYNSGRNGIRTLTSTFLRVCRESCLFRCLLPVPRLQCERNVRVRGYAFSATLCWRITRDLTKKTSRRNLSISGSIHQGSDRFSEESRGRRSFFTSLIALLFHQYQP